MESTQDEIIQTQAATIKLQKAYLDVVEKRNDFYYQKILMLSQQLEFEQKRTEAFLHARQKAIDIVLRDRDRLLALVAKYENRMINDIENS